MLAHTQNTNMTADTSPQLLSCLYINLVHTESDADFMVPSTFLTGVERRFNANPLEIFVHMCLLLCSPVMQLGPEIGVEEASNPTRCLSQV